MGLDRLSSSLKYSRRRRVEAWPGTVGQDIWRLWNEKIIETGGAALEAARAAHELREVDEARTAALAAQSAGCALDQIAKSIIFRGEDSGHIVLFITAGRNQVSATKASAVAGQPLSKADADLM